MQPNFLVRILYVIPLRPKLRAGFLLATLSNGCTKEKYKMKPDFLHDSKPSGLSMGVL